METWGLLWLIWLVVAGGGFAVLETWALVRDKPGDTLSEKTREMLGVQPKSWRRRILIPLFILVVGGFAIWFIPHIIYSFL